MNITRVIVNVTVVTDEEKPRAVDRSCSMDAEPELLAIVAAELCARIALANARRFLETGDSRVDEREP